MAKIGCFKPFRGSATSLANVVLEDGEIAFDTTNKRIYMGNGVNAISNLTPFIYAGNTDISNIGDGSITGAINVLNSNSYEVLARSAGTKTVAQHLEYMKPYYQSILNDTRQFRVKLATDTWGWATILGTYQFLAMNSATSLLQFTYFDIYSCVAVQTNFSYGGGATMYDYTNQTTSGMSLFLF